jgi:hypothetical protein
MRAACIHCGAEYNLKDTDVSGRPKVQFSCLSCGKITVVQVRIQADQTITISPLPSFARAEATTSSLQPRPQDESLRLPDKARITLSILSGPGKGSVHPLSKPRVTIGRKGADIALTDTEVSRRHCAIEVRDKMISLKDLDSKNGTFFEEERVRAAVLLNGAEFRLGSTIIRVTIAPN